jgi:hypothetical protein
MLKQFDEPRRICDAFGTPSSKHIYMSEKSPNFSCDQSISIRDTMTHTEVVWTADSPCIPARSTCPS